MNEERGTPRHRTPAVTHTEDQEMAALARERDGKMEHERSRMGSICIKVLLGIVVAVMVVYGSSSEFRDGISLFIAEQKDGPAKEETAPPPDMLEVLMKTAGAHGHQIDEATRTLGVDPTSSSHGDDPDMRAELEEFTGEKQPEPAINRTMIEQAARRMIEEPQAKEEPPSDLSR